MPHIIENDVETYLINQCETRNWLCYKFTSPSNAGVPDRLIITIDGQVIFCELKRPGEKPRALQKRVIKHMCEHNAIVCIVDTKEKIDDMIQDIEKGDVISREY